MSGLRNIAIIAHVDHGKTTLVDQIMKQAKVFRDNQQMQECFLDSNDLERERGITILSKNISINYRDTKINIIDTPGHCDFGGQVERVLNLADGVILLVDAAEGPMPQTRFVLEKALSLNLKPIVMINKVDKPDSRVKDVLDKVYELFIELDATDEQLDFPILYGSGRDGWAATELKPKEKKSIIPLMDAIVDHIPKPNVLEGPVQMQVATLDYSEFVGRIGIGRVYRGTLDINKPISVIKRDGTKQNAQIKQLFIFDGLTKKEVTKVECGDLCSVVGINSIDISDTITDAEHPEGLPKIRIDQPTISMIFRVNNSPLFGQEGKFVSSRHLRERLFKEAEKDTALKVEELDGDSFNIHGRGVLHLSILIENMRREGYEMSVSQPQVITKIINDVKNEPIEILSVDLPAESAGKVIELAGVRKGEMINMEPRDNRNLVEFHIPTRGLIGLRSKIMTATAGEGIVSHRFIHYAPYKGIIPQRTNGVIISMSQGKSSAFAIDALQLRGIFFIPPNVPTYEGMILGEHCKAGDLVVNLQKTKQLTNVRASGSDKALKVAPCQRLSLEEALEYIASDELLEITPRSIRLRKRYLSELERKRNSKKKAE
ncbi:MAG: translational GTPase TypA [bacterium]|nr:translational GTPase TypA [bacterium]